MQAAHPHFHFHKGNWLICHLTNMNRKFCKMEPDPDIRLYHRYLARKDARGPMSEVSHKVCMSCTIYVLSLLLQKTPVNTQLANMGLNNPALVPPRATLHSINFPTVSLPFYIVLKLVNYTYPSRIQKQRLTLNSQHA